MNTPAPTSSRALTLVAALLVALPLLGGCQSSPYATDHATVSDRQFGSTVREARFRQTADPDAAARAGAAHGGGAESRTALGKYQDSFKTPPKTFNILGIGGTATSEK